MIMNLHDSNISRRPRTMAITHKTQRADAFLNTCSGNALTHPPVVYATNRSKAVVLVCGFVVFTMKGFRLSLTLLLVLVLFFSVLFSIVMTLFWEERASLLKLLMHLYVFLACATFVFFSSSWCPGLAVACDCCTPWTFHVMFFLSLMMP